LHEISNDNGVRVINFARKKKLIFKTTWKMMMMWVAVGLRKALESL